MTGLSVLLKDTKVGNRDTGVISWNRRENTRLQQKKRRGKRRAEKR